MIEMKMKMPAKTKKERGRMGYHRGYLDQGSSVCVVVDG